MTQTHELTLSRLIDAPPARVWDVLANRQEEWFCPAPWRAEIVVQERRAGGRCDMTFYGPAGEIMPQAGIYLAFEEGRRFVTTDAMTLTASGEFEPAEPFTICSWEIEPEERDGSAGTRYTARARHWTAEARDRHAAMGFEAGWGACADQLKALSEQPPEPAPRA